MLILGAFNHGGYPARFTPFAHAPFALRKERVWWARLIEGVLHPLPNPLPSRERGSMFEASPRLGFARATTRMLCLGWQVFFVQHRRRRQTVGPPGSMV